MATPRHFFHLTHSTGGTQSLWVRSSVRSGTIAITKGPGISSLYHLHHYKQMLLHGDAHYPLNFWEGKKKGRGERSKERWLTLGPVIRKLFTDLEKKTSLFSQGSSASSANSSVNISLISAVWNMFKCDAGENSDHWERTDATKKPESLRILWLNYTTG